MKNKRIKRNEKENISKSNKENIIVIVFFVVIILIYIFSPRVYSVNTALYNQGTEEDQKNVEIAMGKENTEERFRLYFQWYNVLHELGHGLIYYNNGKEIPIAEEEQLVNDFAVAYWKYYGEEEKIQELENIANYAVEHIGTNYKNGIDYMQLAKENSNKNSFNSAFFNFNDYGWFQFSSVKNSFESSKSLEEVLKEMGITKFDLGEQKKLVYDIIDEESSTQIINDAVNNFKSWGLKYPKATHHYQENPNLNYSSSMVKYLGIIEVPDIIFQIKKSY